MQTTKNNLSDTKVSLAITAGIDELTAVKEQVLGHLAKDVKVQGFRPGKAPLAMVEKQVSPTALQTEFLETAINDLYGKALDKHRLRPVAQPNIKIKKFVPFDVLEIEAEVEVIGDVTLPEYKKIKIAQPKIEVTADEVAEVLDQLTARDAEKKDVARAAKNGDQAWIDFTGVDAKTKEAVKGADGKDYPLGLGSKTFIPGFEENLVGLKAGDEKTFDVTFPKDYGVAALQNKKVTFTVKVTKVQEVVKPKIDDAFAAKVGPFKTVAELKDDVKKELKARKEQEADQRHTDELITKIAEKTKGAIPPTLIDERVEAMERDERQNLIYRGQTWQEFLDAQGLTEEQFREKLRPAAELRVKAGIVLAEIAEVEKITITPAEFDEFLVALKIRYTDAKMQEELDKPENRRDLLSRLLTEKTISQLKQYATVTA